MVLMSRVLRKMAYLSCGVLCAGTVAFGASTEPSFNFGSLVYGESADGGFQAQDINVTVSRTTLKEVIDAGYATAETVARASGVSLAKAEKLNVLKFTQPGNKGVSYMSMTVIYKDKDTKEQYPVACYIYAAHKDQCLTLFPDAKGGMKSVDLWAE